MNSSLELKGRKKGKIERRRCECCANQDVSHISRVFDVSLTTFAAAAKENPRLSLRAGDGKLKSNSDVRTTFHFPVFFAFGILTQLFLGNRRYSESVKTMSLRKKRAWRLKISLENFSSASPHFSYSSFVSPLR